MKLAMGILLALGGVALGSPDTVRDRGDAAHALVLGQHSKALQLASEGLVDAPEDPWLLYDRGVAELGVGRLDQGIATLRRAEGAFMTERGRGLAAYRIALALRDAHRCPEAAAAFDHYTKVARRDQRGIEQA